MKRLAAHLLRILLANTCVIVFGTVVIFAAPTSPEQARAVVENWLLLDASPLDAFAGGQIREVEVFKDDSDKPLYYIVYLEPEGYVIVSADDLIEPIVGLVLHGDFDPSPENPLGALVTRDLPGRLDHARKKISAAHARGEELAAEGPLQSAQTKWNFLLSIANYSLYEETSVSDISDVRVPPFVQSKWGQSYEGNLPCYNYYTEWNDVYYPSGCVATAMAQLMRYYTLPTGGVGTTAYTITVAGTSRSEDLRGGDGYGGPYSWSSMTLDPDALTGTTARRAIGALTHDAGISVNMNYTNGDSSADTLDAADVLIDTFDYSNAQRGFNSGSNIAGAKLNMMLNPNLDAKYPTIIGVRGPAGGHAIVIDGYGYNLSTLYHHLNMGWNGRDDAWYNLPDIDSDPSFTTVYKCVYNVFPSGTGEIISGRVLNLYGNPVTGAVVTANRTGGGTYSASTNDRGIYALGKLPSSATFTLNAAKSGYNFKSLTVSTGNSLDDTTSVGNLWDVNINEIPPHPEYFSMPWLALLLLDDSDGSAGNPILAKTQLLIGYWHFLYTISTSAFERYYSLDNIDGSRNSQGGYRIYGEDEYGDIVVASYWPDDENWTLFDESVSINRFYTFYTDGSQILANSCYYQVDKSTGELSNCYELSGEKISSSSPSAGQILVDDRIPESTASEEMSRREKEKLAETTVETIPGDILEKYIEQRIAIELHY